MCKIYVYGYNIKFEGEFHMKKKGFTLIELMIVLAVIAILAVVLIPRAGAFKNNAKNAGVSTNVNAVRAFLETKTGRNFITGTSDTDVSKVLNTLRSAFNALADDAENNIVNPLSNSREIEDATEVPVPAVVVLAADVTDVSAYKGSVVVIFDRDTNYTVYGVDNAGTKIDTVTINK
jgi:type IV pilus assembly protein PilA